MVNRNEITNRDKMIDSIFQELQTYYKDLLVINPKDAMCNKDYCFSEIDKIPLFLDQNHLNDFGSRVVAKRYMEISGNPFN